MDRILFVIILFTFLGCSTINNRTPNSEHSSECSQLVREFFNDSSQAVSLDSFKRQLLNLKPLLYEEHLRDETVKTSFKKLVHSISTANELIDTLNMLKSISATSRKYSIQEPFKASATDKKDVFASLIAPLISTSGLITKTLELKLNLQIADRVEIMRILFQVEKQIREASLENQLSFKSTSIESSILHFQMIFDPKSARSYIDFIIDDFSKETSTNIPPVLAEGYSRYLSGESDAYLDKFGPDTIAIFSSFPESVKESLKNDLKNKFQVAANDLQLETKSKRRNIEFLMRVLTDDEYVKLAHSLERKDKIKESELVNLIDNIWNKSIVKFMKDDRYSFQKVLNGARLIQDSPAGEMLSENESFLIYGSFPNGKANFKKSDIDLHPSKELLAKYADTFERWHIESQDPALTEYLNRKKMQEIEERGTSNIDPLDQVEKNMAQEWGRSYYKRGDIISIIPSDHDFFDIEKLGIYNSLVLEIRRDKIIVHLVNSFNEKRTLSFIVL